MNKSRARGFAPPLHNKRGSHIDVILSFVIFISFVVFLYAMMQPNLTSRDSKIAFLNYMGNELAENLTGRNWTMIKTFIEPNSPKPCLSLLSFTTTAKINALNVIIKNATGTNFPAYKSGGDLYIDMSPDENTELLNVYYSPGFALVADNLLGPCTPSLDSDLPNRYTLDREESYTSDYIWSEDIGKLIDAYDGDYNSVKDWFNLSAMNNFRFDFTYQNGTIIGTEDNIPASVNVYSEILPVVYISEGNNLEAGTLTVRVW